MSQRVIRFSTALAALNHKKTFLLQQQQLHPQQQLLCRAMSAAVAKKVSQKEKMKQLKDQKKKELEKEEMRRESTKRVMETPSDGKPDLFSDLALKYFATRIEFKDDRTPEQIAKEEEYIRQTNRKLMLKHRAWQKVMTTRIKTKDAAIAALPPNLKLAAMKFDTRDFPAGVRPAFHTPPIKDYEPPVDDY